MGEKTKILIIDDENKIINAFKRIFLKSAYDILSTTSPIQGRHIIDNTRIDMIISDYNMPDLNGIDLLKHAKEVQPNAVRILMTGLNDVNIAISAINEGDVYYYLTKPWKNEEVLRVVEEALAKKHGDKDQTNLYNYLADRLEARPSMSKDIRAKLSVYEGENIVLLDIQDILYITSFDGNVYVLSTEGKYESNNSLNAWEEKLVRGQFFRCHRSYIVNLDKIEKIIPWFNGTYNLKLVGSEEKIPVSRSNVKALKDIFGI